MCVEGETAVVCGLRDDSVCVCVCVCVCVETGGVWRYRGVCVCVCVETGVFVYRESGVWLWKERSENVKRKMGMCWGQLETDESRRETGVFRCVGVEGETRCWSLCVCVLERLGDCVCGDWGACVGVEVETGVCV